MPKVVINMTSSLDEFVAGRSDNPENRPANGDSQLPERNLRGDALQSRLSGGFLLSSLGCEIPPQGRKLWGLNKVLLNDV